MNNALNKRNDTIDFLKGVSILLVVIGHTIQKTNSGMLYDNIWNNVIYFAIYTFHMPLFMLISGYLTYGSLQRKGWTAFLKSRMLQLLTCILIWGTLHLVVMSLIKNQVPNLNQIINGYTDAIWFLWAVLLNSVIICCVNHFCKGNLELGLLLGFLLSVLSPVSSKSAFMYPFFAIGYYYPAKGRRNNGLMQRLANSPIIYGLVAGGGVPSNQYSIVSFAWKQRILIAH